MWLFRNKSFLVKLVENSPSPSTNSSEDSDSFLGVDLAAGYAEIVKDVVTHTALVVGGVWCLCKIVERLCR